MSTKTVLVDFTPWQTPHRVRGIGRYVRDLAAGLAHALRARTPSVRVLGLAFIDRAANPTLLEDLDDLARGTPIVADADLGALEAHVRWARRTRLGGVARRVGATLVHLLDARGTPLFAPPRVVTCYDLIPLRFAERYIGWKDGFRITRRVRDSRRYHDARHVVAISEETKRDLQTILEVPEHRISVVYAGIDLARWSAEAGRDDAAVTARFGLNRPYVIYVGGHEWRKNAEHMMAAVAALPAEGAVDLAWAGRLAPHEAETVRALAAQMGVSHRVKLLGFVDDASLSALYRRSLGHLLVSRAEGFGLTVVEAMACGAPVITTAKSSLGEVAGDAALQVDPESTEQIAAAIGRLRDEPALRREFSARGAARAMQFSHLQFGQRMLSLYEQLASK